MKIIPLTQNASQTMTITLEGQICQINVYQKHFGVYVDLYVADALVIAGVISEDMNRIVRSLYLGFKGDLVFYDAQGKDSPEYTGLGTRWFLLYLTADEVAAGVASGIVH